MNDELGHDEEMGTAVPDGLPAGEDLGGDEETGAHARDDAEIRARLVHLEPEQFDELVTEVMDGLPREWSPLLDNMAVVVEEEPSEDDIPAGSARGASLFGRYRGAPVPMQTLVSGLSGPAISVPPEIALFQGPLERASAGLDDLRERVRQTLVQEIGHAFGYAEDDRYDEDEDDVDEEEGDEDGLDEE